MPLFCKSIAQLCCTALCQVLLSRCSSPWLTPSTHRHRPPLQQSRRRLGGISALPPGQSESVPEKPGISVPDLEPLRALWRTHCVDIGQWCRKSYMQVFSWEPGTALKTKKKPRLHEQSGLLYILAGEEGFEPSHAGIKIQCLNQLGDSPKEIAIIARFSPSFKEHPLPSKTTVSESMLWSGAFNACQCFSLHRIAKASDLSRSW